MSLTPRLLTRFPSRLDRMIPSSYDIFFERLKSKSDILGRFEAESINVFFGLISLNLNLRDFYLFFGDQIKNNRLIESSLKIEENWKRFRKGMTRIFQEEEDLSILSFSSNSPLMFD